MCINVKELLLLMVPEFVKYSVSGKYFSFKTQSCYTELVISAVTKIKNKKLFLKLLITP